MNHTFTEEYLRTLSPEALLTKYATAAHNHIGGNGADSFEEHKAVRTEVLRRMRGGA